MVSTNCGNTQFSSGLEFRIKNAVPNLYPLIEVGQHSEEPTYAYVEAHYLWAMNFSLG
jgi:hypothetical protein